MKYRDDANLDTSQIQDRRGRRGLDRPDRGLLFTLLDSATTTQQTGALSGSGSTTSQTAGDLAANCRTGADANQRADCRSVAAVNSVQAYWTAALANKRPGYRKAPTVFFTRADISDGLNAAAAIGDDRIQTAATGRARPETFTHGTSPQRQKWFLQGYSSRDPNTCDTWSGAI